MTMTTTMEKNFFSYLLEEPNNIPRVTPDFFKISQISTVYRVIREHYMDSYVKVIPSNTEILHLIEMSDPSFSLEQAKMILNNDISELSKENFLTPKFSAWCTSKEFEKNFGKSLDFVKKMLDGDLDPESTTDLINKVKDIILKSPSTLTTQSFGSDFDDPEAHSQPLPTDRVTTGWASLDLYLGGGWMPGTLNIFAGASNSGKSLWMCNAMANAVDAGYNALYLSLEMNEKSVLKRLGSKRLRIKSDEYDVLSRDMKFMSDKIKRLKSSRDETLARPVGKAFVTQMASATTFDIDQLIDRYETEKGVKIDIVFVDYIQLVAPVGTSADSLYLKGKQVAEGLRSISVKRKLVMVTATQIGKEQAGANDMELSDISESKAVGDTADFAFGIICTPEMKAQKMYRLKGIKFRDAPFRPEQIRFDFDDQYLSIINDRLT